MSDDFKKAFVQAEAEVVRLGTDNKRWADRYNRLLDSRDEWRKNANCYRKERDAAHAIADTLARGEQTALAEVERLKSALHTLATGLRWEEELRAWVLVDLGALTRANAALAAPAAPKAPEPPPHDGEGR